MVFNDFDFLNEYTEYCCALLVLGLSETCSILKHTVFEYEIMRLSLDTSTVDFGGRRPCRDLAILIVIVILIQVVSR